MPVDKENLAKLSQLLTAAAMLHAREKGAVQNWHGPLIGKKDV
jgi:hypothetical protein